MKNIIETIGSVVELKKSGKNYIGLCPFHKEETPSFCVSEEKNFFHCFGCGETGDSEYFIEKISKAAF